MLPYGRQNIDNDDIMAVVETLKSDYLTTGPKSFIFEQKFAEYVGSAYAVSVNSGTAALHLALMAAGVGEGDEVITTANTFAATANSILYVGAKPVFADIEPDSFNINPADVEKKITVRTKAIIPVHFGGDPCKMAWLYKIASKHNLPIIEDACHAISAQYVNQKIGSCKYSQMACFSLHPVKHITTGEGGMVTTNDVELSAKISNLRNHGRRGGLQYDLGFNYRMSDINAALGISQLTKADKFKRARQVIAWKYGEAFMADGRITIPTWHQWNSWHLYVIQVDQRGKLKDFLERKGIQTQIHYIPVVSHPYYRDLGYSLEDLPVTKRYSERCLSLPIFPGLSEWDQEYIIDCVRSGLNEIQGTSIR